MKETQHFITKSSNKRPMGNIAHLRTFPGNKQARAKVVIIKVSLKLLLSPLDKECSLSFKHNSIPFSKVCFVLKVVEIIQVVLEKILNVVNSLSSTVVKRFNPSFEKFKTH